MNFRRAYERVQNDQDWRSEQEWEEYMMEYFKYFTNKDIQKAEEIYKILEKLQNESSDSV